MFTSAPLPSPPNKDSLFAISFEFRQLSKWTASANNSKQENPKRMRSFVFAI